MERCKVDLLRLERYPGFRVGGWDLRFPLQVGMEPGERIVALFDIAGRDDEGERLGCRSGGEELVDEAAADGEAKSALTNEPMSVICFSIIPSMCNLPICACYQDIGVLFMLWKSFRFH